MSKIEIDTLIRDLIMLTNRDFEGEPGILEGLVEAVCKGYQKLIFEDGKTSFSLTQKGIEYVEAMPFDREDSDISRGKVNGSAY